MSRFYEKKTRLMHSYKNMEKFIKIGEIIIIRNKWKGDSLIPSKNSASLSQYTLPLPNTRNHFHHICTLTSFSHSLSFSITSTTQHSHSPSPKPWKSSAKNTSPYSNLHLLRLFFKVFTKILHFPLLFFLVLKSFLALILLLHHSLWTFMNISLNVEFDDDGGRVSPKNNMHVV